jgi:hypothetical protein
LAITEPWEAVLAFKLLPKSGACLHFLAREKMGSVAKFRLNFYLQPLIEKSTLSNFAAPCWFVISSSRFRCDWFNVEVFSGTKVLL